MAPNSVAQDYDPRALKVMTAAEWTVRRVQDTPVCRNLHIAAAQGDTPKETVQPPIWLFSQEPRAG